MIVLLLACRARTEARLAELERVVQLNAELLEAQEDWLDAQELLLDDLEAALDAQDAEAAEALAWAQDLDVLVDVDTELGGGW